MKSLFRFDSTLVARGPAFFIPAAIAAAGAGAQAYDTSQAQKRQNLATTQSILNQQAIQSKGRGVVDQLTRQIGQDTPNQLAGKATGDYVNVLRRNAAGASPNPSSLFGSTSSLAPNVNGNARYTADVGNMNKAVQDYGTDQATTMGGIDAAIRQRQNEGLAANTAGTQLNLLGAQSATQDLADRLRTAAAGQENPWGKLLGSVLQGVGSAAAMNGLGAGGAAKIVPKGATGLGTGMSDSALLGPPASGVFQGAALPALA